MTQTIGDASGVEDHEDHVPSVRGKVRTIGGGTGGSSTRTGVFPARIFEQSRPCGAIQA